MDSTTVTPAPLNREIPDRPDFTTTSDAYPHELYHDIVPEHEIQTFLEGIDTYDTAQKRWLTPEAPANTDNLVNSIYYILSSILRRFVKITEPGVDRVLENTRGIPECEEKDEKGYRACPLLAVQATGPSFQTTICQSGGLAARGTVEYHEMATFFSVNLESDNGSTEELVGEMATYARRILRTQPNRFYVRCLALTEKHARLVHFDRGGAEITPPFDIHQHPSTLMRLVTGLASTEERLLGMDTTIGLKPTSRRGYHGTLTTIGPTGDPKTYPIIERLPTLRDSIHGRATTCWRVQDPDTLEELVVKDSWRSDNRPGEYELLELVKGIPGVVQMVSYETERGETKDFRCPTTVGQYQNRVATRVTLKSYGPSIERFTSALQVLYAIRDAIAAHQRLTEEHVRVLHRDISVQNVLLGGVDAPEHERGVLIDLDLAFRATDANPTVKAEYDLGIRIFQSLSVLGSLHSKHEPPEHDYLDDLEAFFYLVSYIFLLYLPDGTPLASKDEGPSILWSWSEDDPNAAYGNKTLLFRTGGVSVRTARLIRAAWGAVCGDLFEGFRDWVEERRDDKREIGNEKNALASLHSRREDHYSEVLVLFDKAIEAIRLSPPPSGILPNNLQAHSDLAAASSHSAAPTACPPPVLEVQNSKIPVDIYTVELTPANVTALPVPPTPNIPPRRSARIRKLCFEKGMGHAEPTHTVDVSLPPGTTHPAQNSPTTQPRRSARIQKRRLDEEHPEAPQPKSQRVVKRGRVTTRSR